MNKLPKTRVENIVMREMESEILIYDLKTNEAFCLNETSAEIYRLCNGDNSISDISNAVAKKLNQPANKDLVWLALDAFKKERLLEENEKFEINFSGLNRRQVIKKIGLASMVMLPIVLSVVAPNAANAASLHAVGAICSNPSQCASGSCNTAVGPNRCCVPGSGGITGINFCCADPPSCNLTCCTGSGTNIISFPPCLSIPPAGTLSLRITCP